MCVCMDLEVIILSEVSQIKTKSYNTAYLRILKEKEDTNELFFKTERDSQTQKTNLWLPKGKRGWGRDKL